MKSTLSIVLVYFLVISNADAKLTEPIVDSENNKIELGTDAQLALRLWKSHFKLYKLNDYMQPVVDLFSKSKGELPMAFTGHFNNDGIRDIAVMGYAKNQEYFLALISHRGAEKYQVFEIRKSSKENPKTTKNSVDGKTAYGLNSYLSRLPAVMLPKQQGDGIQIEFFRSAATKSYVFNGKKIVPFTDTLKR